MPTVTFLNLPKDKQLRVLDAAKDEFINSKNGEINIKNIVDKADIPRGSFYQYFESKEDVVDYIMELHMAKTKDDFIKKMEESKGDLLEVFDKIFYNTISGRNNEKINIEKKILEHAKQFQEKRSVSKKSKTICSSETEILDKLDRKKYNIKDIDELSSVVHMILGIMIKNISDFKNKELSIDESLIKFRRDLNYLRNGIQK